MSPESEYLLLHDVVPRLKSAISIAVAHVGSEDDAELVAGWHGDGGQDPDERYQERQARDRRQHRVCTLQHLKSGRRTVGGSIADDRREAGS
jgi:hypothetical protein